MNRKDEKRLIVKMKRLGIVAYANPSDFTVTYKGRTRHFKTDVKAIAYVKRLCKSK